MTMVGGFAGIMFKQLGWMVTIIISLSLIIALTLTPMMSAKMLRGEKNKKLSRFDKWYNKRILPVLDKIDHAYGRFVDKVSSSRPYAYGGNSYIYRFSCYFRGYVKNRIYAYI